MKKDFWIPGYKVYRSIDSKRKRKKDFEVSNGSTDMYIWIG